MFKTLLIALKERRVAENLLDQVKKLVRIQEPNKLQRTVLRLKTERLLKTLGVEKEPAPCLTFRSIDLIRSEPFFLLRKLKKLVRTYESRYR